MTFIMFLRDEYSSFLADGAIPGIKISTYKRRLNLSEVRIFDSYVFDFYVCFYFQMCVFIIMVNLMTTG